MSLADEVAALGALRERVDALDTKLGELIQQIELHLRQHVSIRIAHTMSDGSALAYGKLGGTWRLLVEHQLMGGAVQTTPLSSMPRRYRAEALDSGIIEALVRDGCAQLDAQLDLRIRALHRGAALIEAIAGTSTLTPDGVSPHSGHDD